MHRNVTRHLQRRRQKWCAAPGYPQQRRYASMFDYQPTPSSPAAPTPASDSSPAPEAPDTHEDPDASTQRRTWTQNPAERAALLETFDQRSLLDIKLKLNESMAHWTDVPARITPHIPPTLQTAHGAYPLASNQKSLSTLSIRTAKLEKTVQELQNHISDLQTGEYERPGDDLAGWREEIEKMTMQERREKLQELKWAGEAEIQRREEMARANLKVAEGLRDRVVEKRNTVGEGSGEVGGMGGKGKRKGREKWKGKGRGEKGGKAEAEKEKEEGENTLEAMQKRLSAEVSKR